MNTLDYIDQINELLLKIREEYTSEHPSTPVDPPVNTITVKTNEELQNAVDNLTDKIIKVKPGYYDSLILRNGIKNLTLITDATLGSGQVENEWADALVKIKSFKIENRAEQYLLIGFNFQNDLVPASGTIVSIGSDKATDPSEVPNKISFDQCICNGNRDKGTRRGYMLNCREVSITNSLAEGFYYTDDSQAVCGWNGPGPFILYNNKFSASGETVMFGGSDTMSEAMIPRSLRMSSNLLTKEESWRGNPAAKVKNVFELKCMIGFVVEYNIFENSWKDGQTGYIFVITPRNQNGRSPFTQVANGIIRQNVLRNGAAGFNILGEDNLQVSQRTDNILIEENLMYDTGKIFDPNGAGILMKIERAPSNITTRRNTFLSNKINSFLDLDKGKCDNLVFNNNVVSEGSYGLHTIVANGLPGFTAYTNGGSFADNLIVPVLAPRKIEYGVSNRKSPNEIVDFKSPEADKGCDIDLLRTKVTF